MPPKYKGKATTAGNSRALRFDAALFKAHPEFAAGDVTAHVLGPGAMLVTAATGPGRARTAPDPTLDAFLAFLDDQMRRRPDRIRPRTRADVAGLDQLLAGVRVNPDDELPDDFELG